MMRHGSVVRRTMFLASLDIKTAFDEARPRHVANNVERHDQHGWLIAAILREMSGLEGKAMCECVESSFTPNRCLRQGSVEASQLWQMMAAQLLASVEEKWKQKNMGLLLDFKGEKAHQMCSFMWADKILDYVPIQKKFGTDATRPDWRSGKVGLGLQSQQACGGRARARLKKYLRFLLPPTD